MSLRSSALCVTRTSSCEDGSTVQIQTLKLALARDMFDSATEEQYAAALRALAKVSAEEGRRGVEMKG